MSTEITTDELRQFAAQAATQTPDATTKTDAEIPTTAPASIQEAAGTIQNFRQTRSNMALVAPAKETHRTPTNAVNDSLDDDGPVIIAGDSAISVNAPKEAYDRQQETLDESYQKIIENQMKDVKIDDPNEFNSRSNALISEIAAYRKSLMIKDGFTAEEADQAARNRMRNKATEINNQYLEDHPNLAIVKIDKTQSDSVEFTDEERAKLSTAKAIRLVEVRDEALKTISIKKADDKYRYDIIHRATCNISKYELPMISTFDSCTFAGSQSVQLINAVYDENESEYNRIKKQVSLAYDRFMGSTTKEKYDAEGNVIMTEADFANWFAYADLESAIYAIYVASSTESITSPFKCEEEPDSMPEFNFTYNTKNLISYDGIDDSFKKDLDDINTNANDSAYMEKAKSERRMTKRFKSTFTNNIYDISIASCARALGILRYINPKDRVLNYIAPFAMLTEKVYVYDETDGQYVELDHSDPREMIKFYRDLVERELQLLSKEMNPLICMPSFKITTVCPRCGHKAERVFGVDSLVFLKAQGTEEEIQ